MPTVCVAVITRNEERNITDCLEGGRWADELLVLDSHSEDRTAELARQYTSRVFLRLFTNFAEQRNHALDLVESDWVLFVDADERVTPELAAEVRRVTASDPGGASGIVGYWVPRDNYIWGKAIRHGGWYPDYQLRLLRRDRASYDLSREVHETVHLDGQPGYLRNTLVHYNYDTVRQFLAKQKTYSGIQARSMWRAGIHPHPRNFVLQPAREFWRRYVQLGGYGDGWRGLVLSLLLGYYTFYTYGALSALWRASRQSEGHSLDRKTRS